MAQARDQGLVDRFETFFRRYESDAIAALARAYPREEKSLLVDFEDLFRFDPDFADEYLEKPHRFTQAAEEALRLYDLPVDVELADAHVRLVNLPQVTEIREIRSEHLGSLISVRGIVRKATSVKPKIETAAFECLRCSTINVIPQTDGGFQDPYQCEGCEREGPFRFLTDAAETEFIDSQKLRIQESPEGLGGGETPESIDMHIEDDITGEVSPGDHVVATGVLELDDSDINEGESRVFDMYLEGVAIEVEDEEFEEMEITEEEKEAIIELSSEPDIYDQIVKSIAPSIYGYEVAKLAIALQMFSGVTKRLPDGARIRGDIHILLVGDPGTGKCVAGDTRVTLADGSREPIRDLVERNLTDPSPVDDGVYDEVDLTVPSLTSDGTIEPARVTKVWKREAPEQLFHIRLADGPELEVTPSHPLFVQDGGQPVAKKAEALSPGTFLAVPRSTTAGDDDALDVQYRRSQSNNAVRLDLPATWTPGLARLIGFIVAEGYVDIRPDDTAFVSITNNDEEILADVRSTLEDVRLTSTARQSDEGETAKELIVSSSEFARFLESLEPRLLQRSDSQRVPTAIMRASDEIRRSFVQAYVEGEGHVSTSEREITVSSTSKSLLEDVRSMLLTFGIRGQLHERANESYRLHISGDDFVEYVDSIGFITIRKQWAAEEFHGVGQNTNTDVVPNVGEEIERIRRSLGLTQFDCGIPRSTLQHYERGDRNPSRASLRRVLATFRDRLEELHGMRSSVGDSTWEAIEEYRQELGISPSEPAESIGVEQTTVSLYSRGEIAPDGGRVTAARSALEEELDAAIDVETAIGRLERLANGDLSWSRIEAIEAIEPPEEWVYDLEVEGTHSYIANNVLSHNSQLLQYIRHVSPRSVYTSGKGSSSAGLCVTGDTMIHTGSGFRQIGDIAAEYHPSPVDEDTAAKVTDPVYTFEPGEGEVTQRETSHVWRMPEKACKRIETEYGKSIEASLSTPVLTWNADGYEWRPIDDIEPGEYVAVPRYSTVERSSPPVRDYLELTNEKVKPSGDSVEFLRERLRARFGTLREAAAALDLTEAFIYDSLSNRYLPLEKLDRILEAIDAERSDLDIVRVMARHGHSVTIPETFDEDLLYLVGLVFGDGDVMVSSRGGNRGRVRISNGDEGLLERAADIIEDKFDKSIEIEYQEGRVPSIRLHSGTVARLFRNLGVESPKDDVSLAPELTTAAHADAFLRGLFDADGSVSTRDDGGSSIQFSTTCPDLAAQVQLMLETYGVRARRRERDRRGSNELESGYVIESRSVQHHLAMYGVEIERFAEAIGFESVEKQQALAGIVGGAKRRGDTLPVGKTLVRADGAGGRFYQNLTRGDNPSRARARAILEELELGEQAPPLKQAVDADLNWERVRETEATGKKEVFDVTVPGTNNFLGNGIVTHNTAAAVRDDFGDGQQWSLEAGALVLADKGVAAIDELDKMAPEDRSAMHQALEQQEISISKAGINATLKSRCALLGAANPELGRFDRYESPAEQIDLEPALISRFDLIFTVSDEPDEEKDANLAKHILQSNYAGELYTHRSRVSTSNVTDEEVADASRSVEPAIQPELMRKYVAYARSNCFPTMNEEAEQHIRDFYVDLRSQGNSDDSPVPVTARKLEAIVRLAEASARVRLSDTVTVEDAKRALDIVETTMREIGMDPETGQYDADVIETGRSKSQRDRIRTLRQLISEIEDEFAEGAPIEEVLARAEEIDMDREKAEHEIDKLKKQGEVYEPSTDHLRTT